MRYPALRCQLDALGTRTFLRERPVRLAQRDLLRLRVPALGEVPEPLPVAPTRNGDEAAAVEDLEHHGDAATSVPAVRSPREWCIALDLAREHRPVLLELAEHELPEAPVRGEELVSALLVRVLPPPPAHPRLDKGEILDRPDERVPLEELLPLPEQRIELGGVVRSEPAPRHEVLGWGDRRDRVDLQVAEATNRVEQARRGAVEELRPHRDPPRLLLRDRDHSGSSAAGRACERRHRSSLPSAASTGASAPARLAPSQFA